MIAQYQIQSIWMETRTTCTNNMQIFSSKTTLQKQMSVRLYVCPSVRMSACRMSVCPYVRQTCLDGNVIFSAPNWDIAPFFCVQIPLINEHLFCKYFVRLSVGNATKGVATYRYCHLCFFSGALRLSRVLCMW